VSGELGLEQAAEATERCSIHGSWAVVGTSPGNADGSASTLPCEDFPIAKDETRTREKDRVLEFIFRVGTCEWTGVDCGCAVGVHASHLSRNNNYSSKGSKDTSVYLLPMLSLLLLTPLQRIPRRSDSLLAYTSYRRQTAKVLENLTPGVIP